MTGRGRQADSDTVLIQPRSGSFLMKNRKRKDMLNTKICLIGEDITGESVVIDD